jgi:hypothetical protein
LGKHKQYVRRESTVLRDKTVSPTEKKMDGEDELPSLTSFHPNIQLELLYSSTSLNPGGEGVIVDHPSGGILYCYPEYFLVWTEDKSKNPLHPITPRQETKKCPLSLHTLYRWGHI